MKRDPSFKLTENTRMFLSFRTLIILSILLVCLITIGGEDYENNSTIAFRAKSVMFNVWIITIIIDLVYIIKGWNKRVILKINTNGISFLNTDKNTFHDYDWEEIEYIYEFRKKDSIPIIAIKPICTNTTYEINLDGYYWTLLPVRWAFRRIAKDKVIYYTKRQWKKHLKEDTANP